MGEINDIAKTKIMNVINPAKGDITCSIALTQQFAEAFSNFDLQGLSPLIADNVEVNLPDKDTLHYLVGVKPPKSTLDKHQFLAWLERCFSSYQRQYPQNKKLSVTFDYCSGCYKGFPVLHFEEGRFPIALSCIGSYAKLGFAIVANGLTIETIKGCFHFVEGVNPSVYEVVQERIKSKQPIDDFGKPFSFIAHQNGLPSKYPYEDPYAELHERLVQKIIFPEGITEIFEIDD